MCPPPRWPSPHRGTHQPTRRCPGRGITACHRFVPSGSRSTLLNTASNDLHNRSKRRRGDDGESTDNIYSPFAVHASLLFSFILPCLSPTDRTHFSLEPAPFKSLPLSSSGLAHSANPDTHTLVLSVRVPTRCCRLGYTAWT